MPVQVEKVGVAGIGITGLLVQCGLAASFSEAAIMCQCGRVTIDGDLQTRSHVVVWPGSVVVAYDRTIRVE